VGSRDAGSLRAPHASGEAYSGVMGADRAGEDQVQRLGKIGGLLVALGALMIAAWRVVTAWRGVKGPRAPKGS